MYRYIFKNFCTFKPNIEILVCPSCIEIASFHGVIIPKLFFLWVLFKKNFFWDKTRTRKNFPKVKISVVKSSALGILLKMLIRSFAASEAVHPALLPASANFCICLCWRRHVQPVGGGGNRGTP
jgi:hypothetical protein